MLRNAMSHLNRLLATSAISNRSVWVWVPKRVFPDAVLMVALRDDDATMALLHSRFHETWSLHVGASLEDRPRYTPTTCSQTFPFPEGLALNLKPSRKLDFRSRL